MSEAFTTYDGVEVPERFHGVPLLPSGTPDGRTKLGRQFNEWLASRGADAEHPDVTEIPESVSDPREPSIPRLGTPQSGKWLVDMIHEAYTFAGVELKPADFRKVQGTLRAAGNHGRHWGTLTRK